MQNNILHLHWRAGFGLNPEEWQERQNWSIQHAVDHLFLQAKKNNDLASLQNNIKGDPRKMSGEERAALMKEERKRVAQQNVAWISRMADRSQSALLERMSLFWHGHFACQSRQGNLANAQLKTIRKHALGNFRDLVLGMSKDVSMIRYLNNQQNRKNKPNENFARELMELFTLGRGNYTEQDIKEAARAFTGWSSNFQGEFVFRRFQHDFDQKTVFGKRGDFNGDDVIDLILEKKACASFIARKAYRYFVNEKVDERIVQNLADQFYHSGYEIETLMRAIFESEWFYESKNKGSKIKSPIDLVAGMIRSLNIHFQKPEGLIFVQRALGQSLFNPPNVAGWPGGKSWIDNSTLMLRLNLVAGLFDASNLNFRVKDEFEAKQRGGKMKRLQAVVDLKPIIKMVDNTSQDELFRNLSAYLLLASPSINKSSIDAFIGPVSGEEYLKRLLLRLMSLPEYQMC